MFATCPRESATKKNTIARRKSLSFPGGGVKAFYQFGIAEALRKQCGEDLESCDLYGASSGAITAVFMATGVCFRQAAELAWKLADEKGLYDTKLGLVGVWGAIIHEWLDSLLPPDAHILCQGRVHIAVQHVWRGQEVFNDFESREELIHAVLTSVHIPVVLDWRPMRTFKQSYYMDGFIRGKVPVRDEHTVVVEYPEIVRRQSTVKLLTPEQANDLIDEGFRYGQESADQYWNGAPMTESMTSNDEQSQPEPSMLNWLWRSLVPRKVIK